MQLYLDPAKGWIMFWVAFSVFLLALLLVLQGGALVTLDNQVQDTLNSVRTTSAIKAASIFTYFGAIEADTVVTLVCVGLLIWRKEFQRTIVFMVAVYSLAAVTHVLKYMVNRQRPPAIEGYVDPSPSFPSDHCTFSAALVMCIVILVLPVFVQSTRRKVLAAVLLVLPFLVALCRLLLSMHYLSDTIAGIAFGCAWVLLIILFFQRLQKSGVM